MSPGCVESMRSPDVIMTGDGFVSMSCADKSPGMERKTRVSVVIQILNFKMLSI